MKKVFTILIMLFSSLLFLTACNDDNANKSKNNSNTEQKKEKSVHNTKSDKKESTKKVDATATKDTNDKDSTNSAEKVTEENVDSKTQESNNNWVVHNADEAQNLITKQMGDQGWQVVGGTFGGAHLGYDENGKPNPVPEGYVPYITLQNNKDQSYTVSATGEIK